MKKIYWRPHKISNKVLLLLAVFSLAGLLAVERIQIKVKQPYFQEKMAASKIALQAMDTIKREILRRGIRIDLESDPTKSGLIGELMSVITSNPGHLGAKQTTINPNFAAVIVHLLKEAGLRAGDLVAVGVSGSFPALNINTFAALKALNLRPIVISSASASQWGANRPHFTWLDMEELLFEKKVFDFRSVAASLGGIEDRGIGLSRKGKKILKEDIQKYGLIFIDPKSFEDSINQRLQIYQEQAGDYPIKAYVNVGGGTISVGRYEGKMLFKPGLNKRLPFGTGHIDSIMLRFSRKGLPVLHLVKMKVLAEKFGLPIAPTTMPAPGDGGVFFRGEYNPWLVGAVLVGILGSLFVFVRSDLGYRILQPAKKTRRGPTRPEQMV